MLIRLLCATIVAATGAACSTEKPATEKPASGRRGMEYKQYFANLDELLRAWETTTTSPYFQIRLRDGNIGGISYIVIAADRYTAVPALDVYCYVRDKYGEWRLRMLAFLPPNFDGSMPETKEVQITHRDDDTIDIWRDGAVRLSVNLKEYPGSWNSSRHALPGNHFGTRQR